MAATRGSRILMMIRSQDQERLEYLESCPKYESTKETTERERSMALKDWDKAASEMLLLFSTEHFEYKIGTTFSNLREKTNSDSHDPLKLYNVEENRTILDISKRGNPDICYMVTKPDVSIGAIERPNFDEITRSPVDILAAPATDNCSSIKGFSFSNFSETERRENHSESNDSPTSFTDPYTDSLYTNSESSSDSNSEEDDLSEPKAKMKPNNNEPSTNVNLSPNRKDINNVHSMFEVKENSIKLQKPSKKGENRVYDKKQACLYCQKLFSKLPQHIELVHPTMKEVAAIIGLPRKSKERAEKIRKLRNRGNFIHNTRVLKEKVGTLIVNRRSKKDSVDHTQYLPCEYCYGYFQKRKLWHHVRQCPDKSDKTFGDRKSVIKNARLLTPVCQEASDLFQNSIIKHMRDGAEKNTILNDATLCIFGSKEAVRNKALPQQKNHISYKLRLLAKLVLHFKKTDSPITTVAHCVTAENFETVSKTVVKLTIDEGKPSVGTKLGHHLKKCAKIVRNRCIIDGNDEIRKKVEDFLLLYEDEWEERVFKPARDILHRRKYATQTILPSTEDIMSLNTYLKEKEQQFIDNSFSNASYSEVAKIALTHLIIFNRRRPGEVSLLEVESFEKRVKATEPQGEIEEILSKSEKQMFSELDVVYLRGKKGAKVDCLLTPNMVKCLDFLVKARESSGILPTNIYLFCLPYSEHCMRGCDVIKELSIKCGAKIPGNLKSTKLRKHISTVSQLLNLDDGSFNALCKHMGHNPKVHREFYQMPQEMILKTQISKILVALDQGSICKYKGKALNEFDVQLNQGNNSPKDLTDLSDSYDEEENLAQPSSSTSTNFEKEPKVKKVNHPKKKQVKSKVPTKRQSWSPKDIQILKEFFAQEIIIGVRPPTKKRCEDCIVAFPHFKERGNYLNIKWRVNSIIQENNKQKKA